MTVVPLEYERVAAATAVPPTPVGGHIERVRLDRHLEAGRGCLIRVLAPAGYGKTSLVARWAALDERYVCWVDVEHGDDDPVALFAKLRAALAPVIAIPDPSPIPVRSSNPYVDAIRSAFAADTDPRPFMLVLDDVHRLHSVGTGWIVEVIAELLPTTSTVVLVGRGHRDQGSVGRFRLAQRLVDVTVDDLGFDASETHRFLASMGIDSGTNGIGETLDLVLGWPAGLRLTAHAIQRGADPPVAADHLALVDYLRDEWLASIDPDDLGFMHDVACLEQFTGAKCDEVLGRTGSAETLRRLQRDELVVFGLDPRGEWYRLHPLLRRWLSDDLRSSDPNRWSDVHRNAAKFWERAGNIDRAFEHLQAAGDLALLERLALAHGGAYLTRGLRATVANWLDAFPLDYVRDSPGLCGLRCVHALHEGDEARAVQWQRMLDAAVDARSGPETDPTTWWPTVLSAALDERPAHELLAELSPAFGHLTAGPWAAFAYWVHGALSYLVGATEVARDSLAASSFEAELTDNPLTRASALATAAVIDVSAGDHDAAADKSERAAQLLRSCGGEFFPHTAIVLAMSTLVHAHEGRRDDALRHLAITREALAKFRSTAPWVNVIARIPLVRATLLLDDLPLCRTLVQELDHHVRFETARPEAERGDALAYVAELHCQVEAMHQPASGASALTDAELRVLHLMPTNLSLGDIATRLFVSRNTVKSHAASIYRKLGADNRSDAVELAAAAGLLPNR